MPRARPDDAVMPNPLNRIGLGARLALLALLALLPVFGLFTYSAAKDQQSLVALAQAGLRSQALLTAAHQQRRIERAAQLLGDMAGSPSIQNPRNRLCLQYLKNLKAQNPEYANLGVIGLDGQIACDAVDSPSSLYLGDRNFFNLTLQQRQFSIGTYGVSRATGLPGIAFGMPVYSAQGAFNGVAFGTLSVGALVQELARENILDGARVRLLDRHGIVLASHPALEQLHGKPEQDVRVRQAAQRAQPGMQESVDAAGLEMFHAYAPVEGTRGALLVAISVPRQTITQAPQTWMLMNFAALLAFTALGMAFAWAMGQRLVVVPARALLREASEIARGNFQARVSLEAQPHDEIGRLGLAFNQMAQSLQTQRGERDAALAQAVSGRAMLDLMLNSMSEGVIAVDGGGQFLLFNTAARAIFPAPAPGEPFEAWRQEKRLLTLDGQRLADGAPLSRALRGLDSELGDLMLRMPGEPERILRMDARRLLAPGGEQVGGLMVFSDITQLKAAEQFAQTQEEILVLIAGGAPLRAALEAIVRLIEKSAPQNLCCIRMAEDGKLCHSVAPSLPQELVRACECVPIAEGHGACAAAAFRKQTVIIEDTLQEDPLAREYQALLAQHGLRACWSEPVLGAGGTVLATFSIYRRTPARPEPADLALIATATRLARLALERAQAEEALRRSDARFRELATNIEDVFYSVDARNSDVRYVSPGYEKLWGRTCQSLYAAPRSYMDAVLPEDRHVLRQVHAFSRAGQNSNVEYRIRRPDGQLRWVRDRAYPVFNADDGMLERVVGTARDITDSKLAALALTATHRALQMLSSSSIAINRIHDEGSLLAEVCRVAVEVGGYRMAWVGYASDDEDKSIRPVAHAGQELGYLKGIRLCWREDRPEGQGPAGRAMRTGWAQQTGDIRQPENKFHWSEAAVQCGYLSALVLPLCSEKHPFGVLCLYAGQVQQFAAEEVRLLQELADNLAFGIFILRARLAQQRSEEAARKAAAQLHEQASLIDLAPDAIVVRNLDRTLRFWNKGAERLYGWKTHEVLGKTMETQMYRDAGEFKAKFQQILASNGQWTSEFEQRASDGSTLHVEAHSTVLRDEHGQPSGVMAVITDIRERRQARKEILRLNASLEERVQQRTAQLKFANQQLEAFSYSVSHDLRSPLSSINGFSTLLEKSLTRAGAVPLPERSQHYLARIRAGAAQMGELIDAMLALSHVSRSSLAWEPVDLSAQAQTLLQALREREPGRPAQLQVAPGLLAQGDPRLLRQVLDNLLGNAWKFTARCEQTSISVGQVLTAEGEPAYFVRDNGAGFDMAYAPKLFGAFQRLHTEAEFSGTGIGLATVQRIIARHGGRVWAESVQGAGATFYFTLGASQAA